MFIDVKKTSAYWNLLNKATKPTMRKNIGPLKRDDGSLIPDDKEKACRINILRNNREQFNQQSSKSYGRRISS